MRTETLTDILFATTPDGPVVGSEIWKAIPGHIMAVSRMFDDAYAGKGWNVSGTTTFTNPQVRQTTSTNLVTSQISFPVPEAGDGVRLRAEFLMDLNSSNSRVYVGFNSSTTGTTNPSFGWTQWGSAVDLDNQVEKIDAIIDVFDFGEATVGQTITAHLMVSATSSSDRILVGSNQSSSLVSNTSNLGAPVTLTAYYIPSELVTNNPLGAAEEEKKVNGFSNIKY